MCVCAWGWRMCRRAEKSLGACLWQRTCRWACDGQKAACAFNFDYCGRLWGYNSGVDRRFMELSPGWVLLAYVLQWAADNGRSEFDFMRGGEEYKYRFGAVDRHVMKAVVGRGEMPATDEHG